MRINEDILRQLIRRKIKNKLIQEDREARRKRREDRKAARRRGKVEKGDDPAPSDPTKVKRIDDEIKDAGVADAAADPDIYKDCLEDMTRAITLVDSISAKEQGFLAFGKKVKSAKEAKTNRGNLVDLIKKGLGAAKQGDYPNASEFFCTARTLAENPRGGEKFAPVDINPDLPEILGRWCDEFGGKRKSTKKPGKRGGGTGGGGKGKPSPGIKRIQETLNSCNPKPNPALDTDGKWGPNTEKAWKSWLISNSAVIQKNFPGVTDPIIKAAQWGDMAGPTGYAKNYGGMADFIAKICGAGGGGGGGKVATDFELFRVDKSVRLESAKKRKYIKDDTYAVGTKLSDEVLEAGGSFAFGFGGDDITDSSSITLKLTAANGTAGIPLCFFFQQGEGSDDVGNDFAATKLSSGERDKLDEEFGFGTENVVNPIYYDKEGKSAGSTMMTTLVLTNHYVTLNDGKNYQVMCVDETGVTGNDYYAVSIDKSNMTVKIVDSKISESNLRRNSELALLEELIRKQIKNY